MMKSENHTPEHFRELLFHDPASGVMHWKRKVNPHVNPGDVAGCIDGDSYRIISVGDARCLAYVLAFVTRRIGWTLQSELEQYGYPVGWTKDTWKKFVQDWQAQNMLVLTAWILGWLLTAVAMTMGPPFWFDLLNKLVPLRSSVKPAGPSRKLDGGATAQDSNPAADEALRAIQATHTKVLETLQKVETSAARAEGRKEWTSTSNGASLSPCRDKGRLAPSGILPRWRCRHCEASVVTAPGAVVTEKDPQMSHGKTPGKTQFARAKSGAKRPAQPSNIPSGSTRGGTKQEAVLAAQTAQGCNDRHSVRGFFVV